MSQTPILFNAAFTGALAGVSSRWLVPGASITAYKNAALAFATAVDNELGAQASAGEQQAELLNTLCLNFWRDRLATSATSADYASEAEAIADVYLSAASDLEPVTAAGRTAMSGYYSGAPSNGGAPAVAFLLSGATFITDEVSPDVEFDVATQSFEFLTAGKYTINFYGTPNTNTGAATIGLAIAPISRVGTNIYSPMVEGGVSYLTTAPTGAMIQPVVVSLTREFEVGDRYALLGEVTAGGGIAFSGPTAQVTIIPVD